MKILKFLLYLIGLLLLVAIIATLLGPKNYSVDRHMIIKANDSIVYSYVAKFNNWDSWSPWKEMDPSATYNITGEDGAVGTIQNWEGEKSGAGSMEILEAVPFSKIKHKLSFTAPREDVATTIFTIEAQGEERSKLNWHMEGDIGVMGRAYMLFNSMDEMIGPDFERGLFKIDSLASMDQNAVSTAPDPEPEKS